MAKTMKYFLFIIFVIFILMPGCSKKKNKPQKIIPQPTFQQILSDFLIMQQLQIKYGNQLDSLDIDLNKSILQKYQIDSITFYSSLEFYAQHPDVLFEIYKETEQQLKKHTDSLEKYIKAKMPKKKIKPLPAIKKDLLPKNNTP